jgi:hypothetical protein
VRQIVVTAAVPAAVAAVGVASEPAVAPSVTSHSPSTPLRIEHAVAAPAAATTPQPVLSASLSPSPSLAPAPANDTPADRFAGEQADVPTPLPVYATSPPPSLALGYDVRSGEATGSALLQWRVDADGHYALTLQPQGAAGHGAAALTPHWRSQGELDGAGLAPERFAVSRRGRERHAANFRRDAGIISFAGPARTWPLAAGAQDRLSWMVQLPAILQANPDLLRADARISMMVVGAHGEAGAWTFIVVGPGALEGPGGAKVDVWQLRRESSHSHDPQVDVWLAPALHHMPVQMKLTLPRGSASTEMQLRTLQPTP